MERGHLLSLHSSLFAIIEGFLRIWLRASFPTKWEMRAIKKRKQMIACILKIKGNWEPCLWTIRNILAQSMVFSLVETKRHFINISSVQCFWQRLNKLSAVILCGAGGKGGIPLRIQIHFFIAIIQVLSFWSVFHPFSYWLVRNWDVCNRIKHGIELQAFSPVTSTIWILRFALKGTFLYWHMFINDP